MYFQRERPRLNVNLPFGGPIDLGVCWVGYGWIQGNVRTWLADTRNEYFTKR